MKKHLARTVNRDHGYHARLGTMEKYGKAVGLWFIWQDSLYRIDEIKRIAPYALAVRARHRGGTPIMVTLSHMTVTYDLDGKLPEYRELSDRTAWAGAAGWLEMNTLEKLRQDLMKESWQ